MQLFETIDRLKRIHFLIQRESTGSPEEFAERLQLKKRQLYNILEEFRDYGANIRYSRLRKTFYYGNDFEIFIRVSVTPLTGGEKMTIIAGCSTFLSLQWMSER